MGTTVDLDDAAGLLDADRDGLLRAASMAGAQVRATAAEVDEGALAGLAEHSQPRSLIWVAGRGPAEAAGAMLAATLSGLAGQPVVVAAQIPPWVGPLDIVVVAGDDPADPVLVTAAATGARRGAQVVIVAPGEGPLREAAAGRAAVLMPRVSVPDDFGFYRYLAAGLAIAETIPGSAGAADLAGLADELDAEALRNSVSREVFTNAAKALALRLAGRSVVLAGDNAATLALARYAAVRFLRLAGESATAAGLVDALPALRSGPAPDPLTALFHDEEIDGPAASGLRILALTLAAERMGVMTRLAGVADVDVVGVEDVPDADPGLLATAAGVRPEHQLATLAVRLEMAAVYLRLARG